MKHFNTPFLQEVKNYVIEFIRDHFPEHICYHNIEHAQDIAEAVEIIGNASGISDSDLEILLTAAWFHDTGYYLGCNNHEQASADIAEDFLSGKGKDLRFKKDVINCILATKMPQTPDNLLEKIICDADLYHLGTEKFIEKSELLRREFSYFNKNMTPQGWLSQSRDFIATHRYHTPYGQEHLYPKLKKNLEILKSKINSKSS